jgi:hypothetical protein
VIFDVHGPRNFVIVTLTACAAAVATKHAKAITHLRFLCSIIVIIVISQKLLFEKGP